MEAPSVIYSPSLLGSLMLIIFSICIFALLIYVFYRLNVFEQYGYPSPDNDSDSEEDVPAVPNEPAPY